MAKTSAASNENPSISVGLFGLLRIIPPKLSILFNLPHDTSDTPAHQIH
jgi:hypothetical protein